MTSSSKHISASIVSTREALEGIQSALTATPDVETLCLYVGSEEPHELVLSTLLKALAFEKNVAAQPYGLPAEVFTLLDDDIRPAPVARLTAPIVMFKVAPLVDHLRDISESLGKDASLDEIGIYLNQLGLTSVSAYVDAELLTKTAESERNDRPQPWDAYIQHVENDWRAYHEDPVVHFASILTKSETLRLLIDASQLEPIHNGTSRAALSLLSAVSQSAQHQQGLWDVTLVAPQVSITFFQLDDFGFTTFESLKFVDKPCTAGIAITPVTSVERLIELNHVCLSWAVYHLDLIATRALQFLSQQTELRRAQSLYLEHADRVIAISNFTATDTHDYFSSDSQNSRTKVLQLGDATGAESDSDSIAGLSLPPEYVLIIGNGYPHKQVALACRTLLDAGFSVATLGIENTHRAGHISLPAGSLTDVQLATLISVAPAIVFPSLYEGFGLPTAEVAASGRRLVLWDTAVSREVSELMGTADHNVFISHMSQLPAAVAEVMTTSESTPEHGEVRSLESFSADVLAELQNLASTQPDLGRVRERWHLFSLLRAVADHAVMTTKREISTLNWRTRYTRKIKGFFSR